MSSGSDPAQWLIWVLPVSFLVLGGFLFVVRFLRIRRQPPQDPEQLLLGAVSESLHERGQLAAILGELRTVHEKLLDALPFGLLWVDQRHQVASLNAKGRELLGVKRGVLGLDAAFVLEPFPWLLDGLRHPSGDVWRCSEEKEGLVRRWELRRIEAPDKVGALVQFGDVTEAEAEEKRRALSERFAELGEMTAGVAHQLKNGLAVLKGHGQLLRRAGQADVAQEILEETENLEKLVQRFLQWAKPIEPQCLMLCLEEAATQAAEELQKRPSHRGVRITVEGHGSALADPMLLHQALINLMENACQASPSRESVRVMVEENALMIFDQGAGMGPETVARMLKPFESGRADGTGLGLPLALKWLSIQGADLRFDVRPEGGTRVSIKW